MPYNPATPEFHTAQSEYYDRASECQRLMRLSSDPGAKAIFKQLRDLWIEVANEAGVSQSARSRELWIELANEAEVCQFARSREQFLIDMDQDQKRIFESY